MVTHSLLSSWLYAMKDNPYEDMTSERDYFQEFLTVLKREPTETTKAMQNGIEFEDLVTAILNGDADESHSWFDAAFRVAAKVVGGMAQFRAKAEMEIDGIRVLLYGRLDWLRAGVIYDTKFSQSYDRGKYFDSTQHPMYFALIPEATEFVYIVSNGTEVWTETYRRDEAADIREIISCFFSWLKDNGLFEIYKEKWVAA
jgi:hypothetical protein